MATNPENWQRLIALDEIPNGGFKCLDVEAEHLLICRLNGEAFVLINKCSHLGLRLDHAAMYENEIVCPHHNACFDVRSGNRLSGPAIYPLGGYSCRVVGGQVEVDMANPDSSMDRYMRVFNAAMR